MRIAPEVLACVVEHTESTADLLALLTTSRCWSAEARRALYHTVVLSDPKQAVCFFDVVVDPLLSVRDLPPLRSCVVELAIEFPITFNHPPSESLHILWNGFQSALGLLSNLKVFNFTFSHWYKDALELMSSVANRFPRGLKTLRMTPAKGEKVLWVRRCILFVRQYCSYYTLQLSPLNPFDTKCVPWGQNPQWHQALASFRNIEHFRLTTPLYVVWPPYRSRELTLLMEWTRLFKKNKCRIRSIHIDGYSLDGEVCEDFDRENLIDDELPEGEELVEMFLIWTKAAGGWQSTPRR